MADGWIKLHRKVRHSSIWKNWELWRLFEWCLLEAAYKPVTVYVGYLAVDLQPGQLIFGRRTAHKETGLSEQTVRTCLHVLTSGKNPALTIKTTKAYSVITIVNWSRYQNDEDDANPQVTHRSTHDQPTTNPQVTQGVSGFDGETSPLSPRARAPARNKGEEIKEVKEGGEEAFDSSAKPSKSTLTSKTGKPKVHWDGSDFTVPDALYEKWDKAYPGVDIGHEINKAAAWIVANPKRAKKDYARFLNSWLGRVKPSVSDVDDGYSLDPALVEWAEEAVAEGKV